MFGAVSASANFTSTILTGNSQTVATDGKWTLSIQDTQANGTTWHLLAHISSPFTANGRTFSGALIYQDSSGSKPIGTSDTIIINHTKTADDGSIYDVAGNWDRSRGLLLAINGNNTAGTYSGTITWTLQNVPS